MSDRTRLTRKPERGTDDPAVLHRLLDEARIAHVGFVRDGSPVVLPMAMGRDEDRLLLHGSTGAGMFLAARSGIEVSVAVTHLDGLVFARSAFDHSMNYRSAVLFGVATPVAPGEKEHASPGPRPRCPAPCARFCDIERTFRCDIEGIFRRVRPRIRHR
ncbi:pyridoxamine 5'-phosphate oxidase family protein [Rhodococcus rhodochrous]|uniref:pyridoxamine 5'-phosphate oxidase family protein n=1 Tax=Rhodococcus rhodochrous TaxID=1829 RepID=UPI0020B1740F|nr:pyridoxamine 5'-phosphate oxidase family protein [Rhodococcus rhodochrous]